LNETYVFPATAESMGEHVRRQAAGQDRFLVGDLDFLRVRFERDATGKVARLVGLYLDGTEEPHAPDGD
jgi:hypothetical protein